MTYTYTETDMSDKNEIQSAIEAGTALARTLDINGTPIILVPKGYSAEEHAHLLPAPTRHKGKAELLDAASFIAYVNAFKGGEKLPTRLYYKIDPRPQFVAVFNDHTADGPAFRDFTAEYNAPLSKEWGEWTANNGKKMTQEDFAFFIERNVLDVTTPPSADILEIVSTLQSTKGVAFASGTRLDNGQNQIKYEETIQSKAGEKGQFSIPDRLEITIPVFEGSTVADRLQRREARQRAGPARAARRRVRRNGR